jgi:hypothetical protein
MFSKRDRMKLKLHSNMETFDTDDKVSLAIVYKENLCMNSPEIVNGDVVDYKYDMW